MNADAPPTYSVEELNGAIGSLLERGFAPRFLVEATVSRPQVKKGHLWMTLTDGTASISAVAWSSKLRQLAYVPGDGDGVLVVGKLNFWAARANLAVQVLDLRPSLTTVQRRFESVRAQLEQEGVIDPARRRALPPYPSRIALLTSSPSSALADMLRTARERWPLTELLVLPIPVQGQVADHLVDVLTRFFAATNRLGLDAIVMARGGGSREDLTLFDEAEVCRLLAQSPVPLITGLGHEDDLTVADLVADHRAATPTAAIVTLLPSRNQALEELRLRQRRWHDHRHWVLERERQSLSHKQVQWSQQHPLARLRQRRERLDQRFQLLEALAPSRWLKRGFAMLENESGKILRSIREVSAGQTLVVRLGDGRIDVTADTIHPQDSLPSSSGANQHHA